MKEVIGKPCRRIQTRLAEWMHLLRISQKVSLSDCHSEDGASLLRHAFLQVHMPCAWCQACWHYLRYAFLQVRCICQLILTRSTSFANFHIDTHFLPMPVKCITKSCHGSKRQLHLPAISTAHPSSSPCWNATQTRHVPPANNSFSAENSHAYCHDRLVYHPAKIVQHAGENNEILYCSGQHHDIHHEALQYLLLPYPCEEKLGSLAPMRLPPWVV